MSNDRPQVETLFSRQMSRADALAIGRLLVAVWPKPGITVEDRADKLQTDRGDPDAPRALAGRSLVARDGQQVVAHALVFPRTIGTSAGDTTIAALAQVCTDPKCRGRNLGVAVTRAALALVDEGLFPFSLFQTSRPVQPFYERLGACKIDNRIFDSTRSEGDEPPFGDDVVMRYPASRNDWPAGDIDLRGPGY